MVERRKDQRLSLEARHTVGVGGERFGQDFDGDLAAELGVGGAPDFAHPALAELRRDPVVRDGLLWAHVGGADSCKRIIFGGGDLGAGDWRQIL